MKQSITFEQVLGTGRTVFRHLLHSFIEEAQKTLQSLPARVFIIAAAAMVSRPEIVYLMISFFVG